MTDAILPLGDLTSTMSALPSLSAKVSSDANVDKTAQAFESMFATELLQPMFEGIAVDPVFGGGHGEEVMRSFMLQEYGKIIAKSGKLGIAAQIKSEMLRIQEGAAGKRGGPSMARVAQNAYISASGAAGDANVAGR